MSDTITIKCPDCGREDSPAQFVVHDCNPHDWAAYDSSDIHQRTAEWQAQADKLAKIEFFVPRRKPLTEATRTRINALLASEMPGISITESVRDHTAFKLLTGFVGPFEAARILLLDA